MLRIHRGIVRMREAAFVAFMIGRGSLRAGRRRGRTVSEALMRVTDVGDVCGVADAFRDAEGFLDEAMIYCAPRCIVAPI